MQVIGGNAELFYIAHNNQPALAWVDILQINKDKCVANMYPTMVDLE